MPPTIEMIAVDLDGTLLNSQHQMSERSEKALKAAIDQGVKVIIATGKTRTSATDLIAKLALNTPGIYLQGLAIYQPDGALSYEKRLDDETVRRLTTFAEDRGFEVAAYVGSRIVLHNPSPYFDKLGTEYGEPMPEVVGPLQNLLGEMHINKLLFAKPGDPRKVKALMWQLERQLDGNARLTQNMLLDMVEILPPNGHKGTALAALIKQMGIKSENVLAIGDADNDIEMIKMAGIGVAMGNGSDALKAVADHVVASNDDDGVAEAVEKFVLKTTPKDETPQKTESTSTETSATPASKSSPEPESQKDTTTGETQA